MPNTQYEWVMCNTDCYRYGINCSGYPNTYIELDARKPEPLAPDAPIPVINTCMEPITIKVDDSKPARLTGGIATKEANCPISPYGENFTVYTRIPFKVTCGNGVTYPGEGVFDQGNGDVGEYGGCGSDRDPNWETPGRVWVDTDGAIHGMYFSFDNGRQEIGFGGGGRRYVPFESIRSAVRGKTVDLPPYAGGDSTLPRPVMFVHGLDVPFDETWGVKASRCNPVGGSAIALEGAPRYPSLTWSRRDSGGLSLAFDYALHFSGTCAENGADVRWRSNSRRLFGIDVILPGRLDNDQRYHVPNWMAQNGPVVEQERLTGANLVGAILVWVPEEYLTKSVSATAGTLAFDPIPVESRYVYAVKFVRARLRYDIPVGGIDWDHASRARDWEGSVVMVDTGTGGKDPYLSGTAPDVISRMKALKKGAEINDNGIYFFNGYRWVTDSAEAIQPLPWWKDAGKVFPGQPGESWALYGAIEQVLNRHYGDAWKTDTSKSLDVIGHSQGGISLREMLANAGGTDPDGNPMPVGAMNAANHIRKVITVNTPHFGSITTTSLGELPADYLESHGRILRDSARTDLLLADVTVDPEILGNLGIMGFAGVDQVSRFYDAVSSIDDGTPVGGLADAAAILTSPIWAPVSFLTGAMDNLGPTYNFKVRGSWLKINSIRASSPFLDGLIQESLPGEIDIQHKRMFSGRQKGAHLALDNVEIIRLSQTYPRLPDGRDLELQTMSSTVPGLGDLIQRTLSQNLAGICDLSSNLRNASCYGFARAFEDGWIADQFVEDIQAEMPLVDFLVNKWKPGYLAKTDIAVAAQSQRAIVSGSTWDPVSHPGRFHDPKTYSIRRFLTYGRFPDTLAPHGEMEVSFDKTFLGRRFSLQPSVIGAPRLGHDIYCALAPDCSDLLGNGSQVAQVAKRGHANVLLDSGAVIFTSQTPGAVALPILQLAHEDTVTLAGDFSVGAMLRDSVGELLGYRIKDSDGNEWMRVQSNKLDGLVWSAVDGTQKRLVVPGYALHPRIEREGNRLRIRTTTWSRQEIIDSIDLPELPERLVVGLVQARHSYKAPPVLLGRFTPGDTVVLDPRPDRQILVWFREERGNNTSVSRPRIVVENIGRRSIVGVDLVYTFRADPSHPPVLNAPSEVPWSIRSRGGDLWDLVYRDPSLVIPPGEFWPSSASGIPSLAMGNGAPWDVFKDPSNDRNFGVYAVNRKILVRDAKGEMLWGSAVGDEDPDYPTVRRVGVWTQEAAVGEGNITKPRLEVRNDGNVPLRNLRARWYFRVPEGLRPVLESWDTPESVVKLDSLQAGLWAVEWFLPRWIQPGQKTIGGEIGIRLADWRPWDRSKAPSRYGVDGSWVQNPWVVVADSTGMVLWGNVPDLLGEVDTGAGPDTGGVTDTIQVPTDSILPDVGIEIRNESPTDTFTIKPRVRLTNHGSQDVHAFSLVFPVRPGVGHVVIGDLWYPQPNPQGCNLTQRTGLPGIVDVVLTCRNQLIRPGAVWPDQTGAVFGVHDQNWRGWDISDDPAFSSMTGTWSPASGVRILYVSNP